MIQRVSRFCRRSFLFAALIFGAGNFIASYAAGLPGEYLVTQRWRLMFSSYSPVSNPALLNEANYLSFRYALSSSMSEYRTHEIGFTKPLGLYQSIGLTALIQGVNSYPEMNNNGDSTGKQINDQQYFLMASYAYNLWSRLTLGVNVNFLMYPFNDNSIGVGFDAGLTYRLFNSPVIGNHLLGVSIQNALMILTNSEQKYPINLRFSLNSTYWERKIETGFDLTLKDALPNKNEFKPDSTNSEWDFNAKLGFWVLRLVNLYGIVSLNQEGLAQWGVAGGFNIPGINNGRDVSLLYQYLTRPDDNLNGTHTFYVKADFGKHREEIYARKMAKMANVSPNNLYVKAVELYSQGNYWDAFFLFSQLYVEFPDFFKNDWVSYFMGSCQENLDMRSTAETAYSKTKSQFSKSAVIPYVDLGLMRVQYRNGNAQGVEKQFNELNKLGVPDSLKYYSYYLMGETELNRGNKAKAKQLFDLIPENHPDYVFAQHSSAIAAATSDNYSGAVTSLENCVQAQVTTNSQKEMVNRSYVFLGYIFYEELTKEEGSMSKAVTALRMVPKNSFYYPDALLGLGWTALKARQWNDCMSAGQELASIAKNTVLKAEGSLLQAYSYMMQKNYSPAASILDGISTELQNYKAISESEYNKKKSDNDAVLDKYSEVAKSAYDLGTARQSALVSKEIDSLHTFQKQYKSDIDKYISFSDDYKRASFFNRSLETVKEDIDYALAKAQKAAGSSKSVKETGKINKETEKIDDQLEKLKKELESEQKKDSK